MPLPTKQLISDLAQGGNLPEARRLCSALCEKVPEDPEAWFLLGAIHGATSDFVNAEACCKKAIALAPQHAMLRFNLAVALLNQRKFSKAIKQFEHAIAIQPDYAEAYRELGNAHTMNKDTGRAISSFKRCVELAPDSAVNLYSLGKAYHSTNRLQDATECLQQAIHRQPDFIDAYSELAPVLIKRFKFDQTINILETAIKQLPESAQLFLYLGIAHQEQGNADTALEYFRKTLSIDPEQVDARIGVAGMLLLQGKHDEANELLELLLKNHPENTTVQLTYATFAHRGADEKVIKMAKTALHAADTATGAKAKFHFCLAQIYERKGELDTAFSHYTTGNKLRAAKFNYASFSDMFDAITETYSTDAISHLPRSGNTSSIPIFVVGMPRSGTSLAEQILSSHPDIFGAGELSSINRMIDRLPQILNNNTPYPSCVSKLSSGVLNQLADEYLEDIDKRSAGAMHVVDKMPLNLMHLGFIELLFPNARIIHCTRDPRDTCLSCYFKHFSGEHAYAYSLTDLGKFYRLYERLMNHWQKVISLPIYTLNYEDLVLNQESETRKLVDFCGLDWNEACLDFHKTERTVATASHDQVREPMYRNSIGRWRNYEKHLEPLFTALHLNS